MAKLFLLFTVTTSIEMYLLFTVSGFIGPMGTVALIMITGAAGAWLAKREGFAVLRQLGGHMKEGKVGQGIAEGALVLAGSMLLLTPGLLTDITGFLFIVPWTRRRIAPYVVTWFLRTFQITAWTGEGVQGPGFTAQTGGTTGAGSSVHEPKDPKTLPFDHPV